MLLNGFFFECLGVLAGLASARVCMTSTLVRSG